MVLENARKVENLRRTTQDEHEREYQQALITIKDKIRESEGPDMKENMQEQIRQWFIECRSVTDYIQTGKYYIFVTCAVNFLCLEAKSLRSLMNTPLSPSIKAKILCTPWNLDTTIIGHVYSRIFFLAFTFSQ